MSLVKHGHELDFKLHERLASKAALASATYFILYLTILNFTSIYVDAPFVALFFGGTFAVAWLLRAYLASRLKSTSQFALWKKLFYASVLLSSLAWGIFCYWVISRYGSDSTTFIVLFPTAGIIGGSVISLAPVYCLLQAHVTLMILPIIIAFAEGWDHGTNAFTVLGLLYFIYISAQARATAKMVANEQMQNITIAKQKSELEISWRQTEEAMRVKSDFLAMMSHEIRTPLNGIIGMSDIMLSAELPARLREQAKTIGECGQILLTLVNDVLDFSKIESGKMRLDLIEMDVERCVLSAMSLFKSVAQKKNIELTFYIDQETPKKIMGDEVRLRQVLINLIGNAIKFTNQGEVVIKVKGIAVGVDSYELYFTVRDTGIGIAKEAQKKIFQPFTQADVSTTRKYGGTGLGITICKRLVELMGGEVGLQSELGKGSIFTFFISASLPVNQKFKMVKATGVPARGRILVVEDNLVNQTITRAILEKAGYTCDAVKNGLQCLAALKQNRYNLVLMDCQMPGMDGYETTRRIRALSSFKDLPIVAMTANALEGDREKCLAVGMNDYISRPIREAAVVEIIKNNLPLTNTRTA